MTRCAAQSGERRFDLWLVREAARGGIAQSAVDAGKLSRVGS